MFFCLFFTYSAIFWVLHSHGLFSTLHCFFAIFFLFIIFSFSEAIILFLISFILFFLTKLFKFISLTEQIKIAQYCLDCKQLQMTVLESTSFFVFKYECLFHEESCILFS